MEAPGSREGSHSCEAVVDRKGHILAGVDRSERDDTLGSGMEEHPSDLVDIGRAVAVVGVAHMAYNPVEAGMIECRLGLVEPCHNSVRRPLVIG
jgi:hypothetical protein